MTLDNFKALKTNFVIKKDDASDIIFIYDETTIYDIIDIIEGNLKL